MIFSSVIICNVNRNANCIGGQSQLHFTVCNKPQTLSICGYRPSQIK